MMFAIQQRNLLLLAALVLPAGLIFGQSGSTGPAKKRAEPAKKPAPPAIPFQPGESLTYRVIWGPAEAATAKLEILPQNYVQGIPAWHFLAKASTVKGVRLLYSLDDQFDSYSDGMAFTSVQYEMHIREPNKQQERTIRMNREGEPAPAGGPSVRVPAGTRDPLGLIYALRAIDWQKTKEVSFPLYDGSKLYEVRAKEVTSAGSVTVPAGTYTASRIELRIFEREKELTTAHFWIWLAMDAPRTPALIEAELPFGKLRVELVDSRAN